MQADRRVVEEILLDCGQQVGEGVGVHAGEGGVVQPVRGPVRGLGAVLVARHRQRCRRLGSQGGVPRAVPVVGGQRQGHHDLVGDRDAGGVGAGVEFGVDGEAGAGGGGADRADDDLVTGQRAAAPVAADPGEQAVLDLG
jgi:hypothetical protein